MNCRFAEASEFESPRWKAVRLGLQLASSYRGTVAIVLFYGLWVLIGLLLCFVLIPFAILGKTDAFNRAINPVARYGFLLPMGLMAATTWAVKLFSRFLWCAIPEPLSATFLAFVSAGGRLAVVVGASYLWTWSTPYGHGLLRPEVVLCSGLAWLGLFADWTFIRTLRSELLSSNCSAKSSGQQETVEEIVATTQDRVTEPKKGNIFTREFDPGAWLKSRFPRTHTFVSWILVPVAYVTVSSLADNGDPHAIPRAIFRLAVVAPAILQVFWVPSQPKLTEILEMVGARQPTEQHTEALV